jgi:16S rRNA (cytosine1402-N4)-methyltransferase
MEPQHPQTSHTVHVAVMPRECLEWLAVRPGGVYVDGTFGGGGHTRLMAKVVGSSGRVLGLDRDAQAVTRGQGLFPPQVQIFHRNYAELPDLLAELDLAAVDGILLDLGLSSDQLESSERGFSHQTSGELDLRFDVSQGEPAWRMLERLPEKEIADLIYQYGEERFSRRIARRIVESRRTTPIRRADELARLVRSCVPRSKNHSIDPATRTFQALRIAVNQELRYVELALGRFADCLKPGGRLVVMSFHSLEDRLVKQAFVSDPRWERLTKKPLRPSEQEQHENPRSRSAKLRAAARK